MAPTIMKSSVNQWHHSGSYLAIASVCLSTSKWARQQPLQYCNAGIDADVVRYSWGEKQQIFFSPQKGISQKYSETRHLKGRIHGFMFHTGYFLMEGPYEWWTGSFFSPCSRHRCSTFPHNEAASAGSNQCGWRAHLQTESWSYSSNHSKDMGGRQQLEIVFPVWLWTRVVTTWW